MIFFQSLKTSHSNKKNSRSQDMLLKKFFLSLKPCVYYAVLPSSHSKIKITNKFFFPKKKSLKFHHYDVFLWKSSRFRNPLSFFWSFSPLSILKRKILTVKMTDISFPEFLFFEISFCANLVGSRNMWTSMPVVRVIGGLLCPLLGS